MLLHRSVGALAGAFGLGLLLQFLGCALWHNWWPMLTAFVFVLVPMPYLFFGGGAGGSNLASSWQDAGKFLVGFSAVAAVAIPAILYHAEASPTTARILAVDCGRAVDDCAAPSCLLTRPFVVRCRKSRGARCSWSSWRWRLWEGRCSPGRSVGGRAVALCSPPPLLVTHAHTPDLPLSLRFTRPASPLPTPTPTLGLQFFSENEDSSPFAY